MPFTQRCHSFNILNIMWHFEFYNLCYIKLNVRYNPADITGGKEKKQTHFSMSLSRNMWHTTDGVGSEGGMWMNTCINLLAIIFTLNKPSSFPPWGGRPSWGEEVALSYEPLQEKGHNFIHRKPIHIISWILHQHHESGKACRIHPILEMRKIRQIAYDPIAYKTQGKSSHSHSDFRAFGYGVASGLTKSK